MTISVDVSTGKLKDAVTLIDNCATCLLDAAQITSSLKSIDTAFLCVATCNDLPPASENEGRFVYITGNEVFRYSDGYDWVMDACSCFGFNGALWTWGYNVQGNLGDGTQTPRCSPGTVAGGGTTWCQVFSGVNHSAVIKTDGTLWTWGGNAQGRLGDGTTTSRRSPGTVAGGGTTWCQVSGGSNTSSAIKTDGTLWTWGYNRCGALGEGTTLNRCSPGTVAGGGTTWCQVSGGNIFTAAIKTDGTLWTWGYNICGSLGDGTTVSRSSPGTIAGSGTTWCKVFSSINGSVLAIKTDGTLWTWGKNGLGVLGDGTQTNRCSPGTVAGGDTCWCQFSIGFLHAAAIKTDGTLWTWGSNGQGRLGDGTVICRSSPGTVAGGGTTWCQVSSGGGHIASIKTDGTLWTWGGNTCGALGNGTITSRSSPGTIAGSGTTWCQIFAGSYNSFAIRTRGF